MRKNLSLLNRSWVGTDDLPKLYSSIRALVKEKTGRAMQEKAGSLYEGVVVIDERTGINDLLEFGRRFEREFGYKLLQAYIHADERHYGRVGDPSSWKPNLHAYLVFDRYDHETGKGIRTTRADTERMQDICAEVFGMERGLPSDKKHLDARRYKAAALEAWEEVLEARIGGLGEERKGKAREVDRENGRAILRGVANVFGKGKYIEIGKENVRLRDELAEEEAEKKKLAAANKKLKAEKEKLKADISSTEEKGKQQGEQEGKVAGDSLRREFKEAYEKAYRLPEG